MPTSASSRRSHGGSGSPERHRYRAKSGSPATNSAMAATISSPFGLIEPHNAAAMGVKASSTPPAISRWRDHRQSAANVAAISAAASAAPISRARISPG